MCWILKHLKHWERNLRVIKVLNKSQRHWNWIRMMSLIKQSTEKWSSIKCKTMGKFLSLIVYRFDCILEREK